MAVLSRDLPDVRLPERFRSGSSRSFAAPGVIPIERALGQRCLIEPLPPHPCGLLEVVRIPTDASFQSAPLVR